MKNFAFTLLIGVSFLIFITSCDDDDDMGAVDLGPDISIVEPVEDQIFQYQDTVFINVLINHNAEVEQYTVELKNLTNDIVTFSQTSPTQGQNLEVTGEWVNEVQDHSDMELTVLATDEEGNSTTERVRFHCMPDEN